MFLLETCAGAQHPDGLSVYNLKDLALLINSIIIMLLTNQLIESIRINIEMFSDGAQYSL